MLPNFWYAIWLSSKVKKKPARLKRFGLDLVVWRDSKGRIVCMENRCPHRGSVLNLGRIEGDCIECPYHGFQYDQTGKCTIIPCNKREAPIPPSMSVKTFPAQEAHGFVWMWWGDDRRSYPDLPWLNEIPDRPEIAATIQQDWSINYARLVESHFDLHHFPFVHRSINFDYIGPLVDPFEVEVDGEVIKSRGSMRHHDDKKQGMEFAITMRFPNLTCFEIPSTKTVFFVIATPIDQFNSWVTARYYQLGVWPAILAKTLAWLFAQLDLQILQRYQDLPVLRNLSPRTTKSGIHRLVKADQAIGEYLKIRDRILCDRNATAGNTGS